VIPGTVQECALLTMESPQNRSNIEISGDGAEMMKLVFTGVYDQHLLITDKYYIFFAIESILCRNG